MISREGTEVLARYIVLDLEWNQAESSRSSVFKKLPFHLSGEIIQIGAVKLADDFTPREEFKADIKPVYFRRMHRKVGELTGKSKDSLKVGLSFETAMEWFREWCGADEDGCVLLTWGTDDKNIMEQNVMLFDLDGDWMSSWVNLQSLYNSKINGDGNQKSLKSAMEHFGIAQTRTAHDAQADAYNTALVCSKLELEPGLESLGSALFQAAKPGKLFPETKIKRTKIREYSSLGAALNDKDMAGMVCPVCAERLENTNWVSQGDGRYMALFTCSRHGDFLLRLRFKREGAKTLLVNRLMYEADEEMRKFYENKADQAKQRRVRNRRPRRRRA